MAASNIRRLLSGNIQLGDPWHTLHDGDGNKVQAGGTTVPSAASGYAVGCPFLHTDGSGANDLLYINVGTTTSCTFVPVTPGLANMYFESIPLLGLREASAYYDEALLDETTTPALLPTNGDTDGAQRVAWAASNSDPIVFQVALPPYLDTSSDLEIHFRASMSGSTDTPTIASDAYFNEGDTKVEDVSAACGASYAENVITIAAADIPAGAQVLSVELTPGAHTTDILYLTGLWLEGTLVYS